MYNITEMQVTARNMSECPHLRGLARQHDLFLEDHKVTYLNLSRNHQQQGSRA